MPKRSEIYKCDICGNIVDVLIGKTAALVCCGQNMTKLEANTTDAATEKHVPVIEATPDSVKVKVGSVEHPMTEEHYIEWIEIIADNKLYRKYLTPQDKPEACFCIKAENIIARAHCNLHGLWKG